MSKEIYVTETVKVNVSDIRLFAGEYVQVHCMKKGDNGMSYCVGTIELRILEDGTIELYRDVEIPDAKPFDTWYDTEGFRTDPKLPF